MRTVTVLAGLLLSAGLLAGCRSADPFCQGRNAADLTPTARAYAAMPAAERAAAQRRLDEAARRCGWEP